MNELTIDDKGRAVFGHRAAARVVGVSPSTIHKFSTRVFANESVEWLEPISSEERDVFAIGKLLDITVYKFLLHYAEEGNRQADKTLKSMGAVGIRAWARDAKGWIAPQQFQIPHTLQEALRLAADEMDKRVIAEAKVEELIMS